MNSEYQEPVRVGSVERIQYVGLRDWGVCIAVLYISG